MKLSLNKHTNDLPAPDFRYKDTLQEYRDMGRAGFGSLPIGHMGHILWLIIKELTSDAL